MKLILRKGLCQWCGTTLHDDGTTTSSAQAPSEHTYWHELDWTYCTTCSNIVLIAFETTFKNWAGWYDGDFQNNNIRCGFRDDQ